MKRESGESPEQSRCCKLTKNAVQSHFATASTKVGRRTDGVSQKTCKTREMRFPPCSFEERELGNVVIHTVTNVNKNLQRVLMGLLALSVTTTYATTDVVQDSLRTIDEVEITARALSKQVSSISPTQQMGAEQLKAIAAHTVADAVRHFSGTNVKDYGGIGGLKTVSVRGLGATHTAVSYDDAVVSNCLAGQIDLGRFASSSLDNIALHIGQSDNMLSTARALASGSLVSLSSHQPNWGAKCYTFESTLQYGSYGFIEPAINYSRRFDKRTWSSLNGSFSNAHGRYPYTLTNGTKVTTEQRTNTDITQFLGEWDLHHQFADNSELHTKLYGYASERGLPGAVILYNNNSTERLADRTLFFQARYSKQWNPHWQLRAIAKYTYGWNRYTDTNVKYAEGKQVDENLQREYYAQATLLYRPTLAWSFSLAQDGFINTLESNLPSCPFPVRYTSLTAMQAQYRNHWLHLRGILLGTLINEISTKIQNSELRTQKELTPTLSASLRPLSDIPLYLRLMYKHTFRMPTFNDLYYFRSGNKDLRPERAREYNLGLTWQAPQWGALTSLTLTADGYFNNVTDKIVAFPTTYVWKMANYGRVHITGLDATLDAKMRLSHHIGLNLGASYTLQHAIDVTNPGDQSYGIQLPYTPLHSGSTRLLLSTPWGNVGYSTIWSGQRYSMSELSPRYRLAPYMEHTLSFSHTFTTRHTLLTARAEAINLTNAQYQVIQYYPMPGRQFRLSFTVKI